MKTEIGEAGGEGEEELNHHVVSATSGGVGEDEVGSESMLEWVDAVENQENPLLDEVGDPPRPSRFITEAIEEEEAHP
ncbi:hypothetical protein BHE74_00044722 [Ensete ventricosum]|nr:hypothetical protein BHE74_00044722 [Ensete ventricosum]